MRRTPLVPVVTLAAALALTGCGAGPVETAPSPTPIASDPSVTPPGSVPPVSHAPVPPRGSDPSIPTRPPASGPPKEPTDVFKPVTLSGTIRITGDCRELVTDTVTWTLLGPDVQTLAAGAVVEVTGTPNPNVETGCSGSPLRVRSVRPR